MWTLRLILAGLLSTEASLLLTGCASTTGPVPYPTAWAPLDSSTTDCGCPNLTGTYSNLGSGTFPVELGEPPTLSQVFARMGRGTGMLSPSASGYAWPEPVDVASVALKQERETLLVTFISKSGEETPLVFRRYHFKWNERRYDDLFTCYASGTGSRLRFMAEPEGHTTSMPNFYIEGGGTLVFLLKSTDGSLVVQWRNDSLVFSRVILGTHLRFNSVWWRYPPQTGTQ